MRRLAVTLLALVPAGCGGGGGGHPARPATSGDTARARRIEGEDLPVQYRSDFNRALLVFGEKGYAIR